MEPFFNEEKEMSFSSIDLCSKALNKIGANSIVSFDEGTPEAEICGSLYSTLKYKLLSIFSWGFATSIKKLNQVVEEEQNEYGYTFALPSDFIRALKISSNSPYKILGNYLYCNDEEVVLTYIANVGEEYFSPLFVSAFIYLMAAELSVSLLNDTSKYSLFYKLFNSEIRQAKSIDSQQETPKVLGDFPLISARG